MSDEACLFVGNIGSSNESTISNFFEDARIRVRRVDIKVTFLFLSLNFFHSSILQMGYSFVYCDDFRDLRTVVDELNRKPFGRDRRYLKIQFSKKGVTKKYFKIFTRFFILCHNLFWL